MENNSNILKAAVLALLIIIVVLLINNDKENKNAPIDTKVGSINTKDDGYILNQKIEVLPALFNITKSNYYSLDCKSNYYTDITIAGSIIPESSILVSQGSEKQVLYIQGNNAKYFGADFTVTQDDSEYLVIVRSYSLSGLSEVVSIDKKTGIGFDTKTFLLSLSGAPKTSTYNITCEQI